MSSDLLLKFFPVPKFLTRPAVGLDITDQSIKVIELLKNGESLKLGRFGEISLPVGTVEAGELKNMEAFILVLKELKSKYQLENVFISLPDDHTFALSLDLPNLKPEEIYSSLELQIEEYVPLPATEIVFDFSLINSDVTTNLKIGVIALPRSIVSDYQEAFHEAGLSLLAIETQSVALTRTFSTPDKKENLVIIDIGRNHSSISAVLNGVVVHTTAFLIGGEAITRNLQKGLGVEFAEAEKIKMSQGLSQATTNQSALEAIIPVASALREEVERHLNSWFQNEDKKKKPERIVLIGGQAALPGFAEYLGNHLNCPVETGNPWQKVFPVGQVVSAIPQNEALRFATATGLALRNFNL